MRLEALSTSLSSSSSSGSGGMRSSMRLDGGVSRSSSSSGISSSSSSSGGIAATGEFRRGAGPLPLGGFDIVYNTRILQKQEVKVYDVVDCWAEGTVPPVFLVVSKDIPVFSTVDFIPSTPLTHGADGPVSIEDLSA